ncbi:MAG: hypothetical protein JW966_01970 [Anaerolineae bacterium]|nr:hypothetical protein [Anaerolineae bacterium]
MSKLLSDKRVAYGLILVGFVGGLLSVLIDPLRGEDIYLHVVQIIGVVLGLVMILAGAYLTFMYNPPPAAE